MNNISMIALLSFFTLLPFLIAAGTCFIKFSIVFVIVRNALGLQQVPSTMTLNGVALILSAFVMAPVGMNIYAHSQESSLEITNVPAVMEFINTDLESYRVYLKKYADPELVSFFEKSHRAATAENYPVALEEAEQPSILSLMPAYALSEIKSAFKIGFYIYLPFVVIDLVISSVLLTLGMMMMSPVTISTPVKLIVFVAMDGWTLLSKGLILQYVDLATGA